MDFQSTTLDLELNAWAAVADLQERACGQNIGFEERISNLRRSFFETYAASYRVSTERLRRCSIDYYREYVRVDGDVPHTFAAINADAALSSISPEQKLIRVEGLRSPLDLTGITFGQLDTALSRKDGASRALVDLFVRDWNTRPDISRNPISFATFKDEFREDIAATDWPDRLRNKLGLGHYDPAISGPIPVALMEYEVSEVLSQVAYDARIANPFCAPTSLDTGPWAQFFPSPKQLNFGCPMALETVYSDDALVAEVVHPRLMYKQENFKKIGIISSGLPSTDFKEMRDNHLWALRIAADRIDFGAEL